jgi:hypothetical protein
MEVKSILIKSSTTTTTTKTNSLQSGKSEKKRVVTETWNFTPETYLYENQLKELISIRENNYTHNDILSKTIIQQIKNKISGYKQQDTIKKLLQMDCFISLESIIGKLIECELNCYYCSEKVDVLYQISREMKQWTVDRINNNKGHNIDNFYIACLECNLKRRRRSDEKFLFTKKMKLVKVDKTDKDCL